MKEKDVIRRKKTKKMHISIRIHPEQSKWMEEKNYSPTKIFNQALKDLGYEQKKDD